MFKDPHTLLGTTYNVMYRFQRVCMGAFYTPSKLCVCMYLCVRSPSVDEGGPCKFPCPGYVRTYYKVYTHMFAWRWGEDGPWAIPTHEEKGGVGIRPMLPPHPARIRNVSYVLRLVGIRPRNFRQFFRSHFGSRQIRFVGCCISLWIVASHERTLSSSTSYQPKCSQSSEKR